MEKSSHTWLAVCSLVAFLLPLGLRFWPLAGGAGPVRAGREVAVSAGSMADNAPPRDPEVAAVSSPADTPRVRTAAWWDEETDGGGTGAAQGAYTPLSEFQEIKRWLGRLFIATSVVLAAALLLLQWGARWWRAVPPSGAGRELQLAESLVISRDAGVKLLRLGDQRFLVGHDRNGIRDIVMVPSSFGDMLGDLSRPESTTGKEDAGVELRGFTSRRSAFGRPEESGWDLTRPMS